MLDLNDIQLNQKKNNKFALKYRFGILILFCILSVALFKVQLREHKSLFSQSQKNYIRVQEVKAERGLIKDRYGNILAMNKGVYEIRIYPNQIKNIPFFLDRFSKIKLKDGSNPFDLNYLKQQIKNNYFQKHQSINILDHASHEVVAIIEENSDYYLGAFSSLQFIRHYPYGHIASHVLGYTSKISPKQFYRQKAEEKIKYSISDLLGISGLEKQYEHYLKGINGQILIQVNVKGLPVHIKGSKIKIKSGYSLTTTIDLRLQEIAEESLKGLQGSIVVLDPRNGEVLVMASNPSFNPNVFSLPKKEKQKAWNEYIKDPFFPLINRSISGLYDPASIFKLVVSIASFRDGVDANHDFEDCSGSFKLGKRVQKCWLKKGHGKVAFYKAFEQSCDVYYYHMGLRLEMDKINSVARELGLEEFTGIDLPYERKGLLIDSLIYEKRFQKKGWKWTKGILLNLAIGQGLLTTPIQIANLFAAVANSDGIVYQPHLFKELRTIDDKFYKDYKAKPIFQSNLSFIERRNILEAMRRVVEEKKGTGRSAYVSGITVGGKTGSAEIKNKEKTNALFGAIAPLEDPKIVIAIVIQNAGHGGSIAAPIAGRLMRTYFGQ